MPFVPEEAIRIFENGGQSADVAGKVKNFYGDLASPRTARRWHLYWRQGVADPQALDPGIEDVSGEEVAAVVKLLRDRPMTAAEISDRIDRSVRTVLRIISAAEDAGYNILRSANVFEVSTKTSTLKPDRLPDYLVNNHRIRFAVISDIHAGSKAEQITALQHFLQYAREQGVKIFFGVGDYMAGFGVYRNQLVDLYLMNADEQIAQVERSLAFREDERWFLLGGNHDFSFVQHGGSDVLWQMCRRYPNVYFLGYDMADVNLTPQVGLRLWHPRGGVPYAASYRLQKGMERAAFEQIREIGLPVLRVAQEAVETKPLVKVVLAGHLHIDAKIHQGGVLGIQCACFEGLTNYLRGKGLHPQVGGYIVELDFDDFGTIVGERIDFRTYRPIEDDYKNYEAPDVRGKDTVEVVFSLQQ